MCISLLRTEKKQYFANLRRRILQATKRFDKLLSLFFQKKQNLGKNTLIENKKMVSDDAEIANCPNNIFSSIVKNVEKAKYEIGNELNLNLKPILKYRNHPSVICITRFCSQALSFNFSCIDENTILKEIGCLSTT